MSDIENTTISVRTLIVCIYCMAAPILLGVVSVVRADWMLSEHGKKLDFLLQDRKDIDVLQVQVAALQQKRIDYQNYKWSTPMMIEWGGELNQLNPNLKLNIPSADEVHNDQIKWTP